MFYEQRYCVADSESVHFIDAESASKAFEAVWGITPDAARADSDVVAFTIQPDFVEVVYPENTQRVTVGELTTVFDLV